MPKNEIITQSIRQGEIRTLNNILLETQSSENFTSENSIRIGNIALYYSQNLRGAIANSARDLNIHLEGEHNTQLLNEIRTFINNYYNEERYPLHSNDSLLAMLGRLLSFGYSVNSEYNTIYSSITGKGSGFDDNHDHDHFNGVI